LRLRRPNPQDDLEFRIYVVETLARHDTAIKILIMLVLLTLGLVVGLWVE